MSNLDIRKGSGEVSVLYVEDDRAAAWLMKKRLTREGYCVELAYDGEEGLSKWLAGTFDVLATDHDMPKLKGLELIRELAAKGPLPPTIMITGHGNETIAVEAMKLGADDYIIKDPGAGYLTLAAQRIEEAIKRRKSLNEKRRAEQAVLDGEARFRLLVESSPDAIFVQTDGRFAYLNPAAVRLYGAQEPGRLLGRPVLDRVHPDFHAAARERIRLLNKERTPQPPLEQVHIRVDRTYVNVEVWGTPIVFEGKNGALVFVRDITQRKQAERALEESEREFRSAFEQAAVGMCHSDLNGGFARVNRKLCDIVGYSADELCLMNFREITHPDDLGSDVAQMGDLMAGQIPTYSMEKRYVRKDHSHVWVNLTVSLVRDEQGRPKYFLGVIEDITARRTADDAAQLNEKRLAGYLDSINRMGLGVLVVDGERRIRHMNEQMIAWFGDHSGEICRQSIAGLAAPCPYCRLDEVIRENITVRYQPSTPDGRTFDIVAAPLHNADGSIWKMELIADITERKKMEQAREPSNELSPGEQEAGSAD